jgi:hypothetical protein
VVLNDVRSDVTAAITNATVHAGAVSLTALETAVIRADADSSAVASGGSAFGTGSVIAVNGTIATNIILSTANATITGSTVTTTVGDLTVAADNLSQIDALTHSATTSGDKAVGVTLAFNTIGWMAQNVLFNTVDALLGDPAVADAFGNQQPAEVQATIVDSTVNVAGNLVVTGMSEATINAHVDTGATSAAVALVGASGASAGIVLVDNKVASTTRAAVEFTGEQGTVNVGGGMTVAAEDYAAINARNTLEAISTVTNDAGYGIVDDLKSAFHTEYHYTTNSGSQLVVTGQSVRVADDYEGGGIAGEVYLYIGGPRRCSISGRSLR